MIPLIALCLTVPLEFGLQPLPEDSLYRDEGFTKYVEVIAPNGKPISERITLYRDYSFDENNVMGNTDREDYIKKDMMSTASTLIFNKLKALTNN